MLYSSSNAKYLNKNVFLFVLVVSRLEKAISSKKIMNSSISSILSASHIGRQKRNANYTIVATRR